MVSLSRTATLAWGFLGTGNGFHFSDSDGSGEAINLRVDIHDDKSILVNERSDIDRDTDLHLLNGGIAAIGAAAIIAPCGIGLRLADEQARGNRVGGLNPGRWRMRALLSPAAAVTATFRSCPNWAR